MNAFLVRAYDTVADFPTFGEDGEMAISLSPKELYTYNVATQAWELLSGGGGGGVTSVTDDGNTVVVVDNSIPTAPVITFGGVQVDAVTIIGDGSVGNPLEAVIPSLAGYVPYTGATGDVDLGSNDLSVDDEAYGAGWNGSLEVPTKNAVYDKINSLSVTRAISIILYDGGNDLTTGIKDVPIILPFAGTVTGWEIMAYDSTNTLLSTSCVVDILSDTFANLPLAGGDSIAGSEKPTLSGASTASDNTITTWTALTLYNYIQAEIESINTGVARIVISIKVAT